MSKIQVNDIVNHYDTGAPQFPKGIAVGSGATLGLNVGTGASIYSPSDNVLTLGTNNTERVRITSAGLIGISEATPDSKLDILHSTSTNSSTENLIHLRTDPGAGYVSRGLFVKIGRDGNYDNSAVHYDIVGSAGNSGTHIFEVQGSEKLRINKDGKVRVGSGSAAYNLEIYGSGAQELLIGSSNASLAGIILDGDSNGDGAGGDYAQIFHNTDGTLNFRTRNPSGGTDTIFYSNTTETLRIKSTGQLNVNQANNNNLYGRVTIHDGGNFTTNSIPGSGDTDNIYLISDATSGYNAYGSSITWSRVQYADRRAAAIANVQTSTDEDHVGLAFFTHPSADATANMEEKFRITHDGIHITNGVSNFYAAFALANNGFYYWDIAVPNEGGYGNSFRVEAGYNHFYTTAYGAHRSAWVSARGTSLNVQIDQDQSNSQAGGWGFSKPNNTTLRIQKSAGSYSGTGYGFLHVRFNYF